MIELASNKQGKHWVRIKDGGDIISITTDMRDTKQEALADLLWLIRVLNDDIDEGKNGREVGYYVTERLPGRGSIVRKRFKRISE